MPNRRVYGLAGLVAIGSAILLLVLWQYVLAALALGVGIWMLRRGERVARS